MNVETLLRDLKRRVPEFTADDLFLDLPYVVFGGFSAFIIDRLRKFGSDDPVIKRSFDFVNDVFHADHSELVNIVETTLFEQLADDATLTQVVQPFLERRARLSLEQIVERSGSQDAGLT